MKPSSIGFSAPRGPGAERDPRLAPGVEDLRSGRFEIAATAFEAAARGGADPNRATALAALARFGSGLQHVHAGDFAAARGQLEQALRLDPGQAPAARLLARVMLRAGEVERALELLDHAAIEGNESHEVLLLRAACLEAMGWRQAAGLALDQALATALRSPLARRRGRAFPTACARAEGDLESNRFDAAQAFHADRRCELAIRLFEPRPAEAAHHLEAALALNPRYLRARLALGLIRLKQGRAGEAVAELEAARELEPTYPDVRAWLGLARLVAGDARGAASALERAVALRREFARAHRTLALAYHALGRPCEALRAARRGWIRDTDVAAFGERLGLPGLEAEAADLDQLSRAVAIRPRSPDLHLALGRRLGERGEHAAARDAFRAALAMRPGYAAATLELARVEIALSRVREAESHLTDLVGWRPAWVDAQALLGRTRLLLGDPRGALIPLRAAVRQRPDLEPARSDLAWAVLANGKWGARDARPGRAA